MPDIIDFESTVVDFYKSNYFTDLPINDISAILFAEKLCGNEDIKQSDQADIDNIAAFLPYVNYMIIDKSMADKVNKHKLDKKYGTNLIRLKELDKVIETPWTCSISSRKAEADTRRAPWPKMISCSGPSEVATFTR